MLSFFVVFFFLGGASALVAPSPFSSSRRLVGGQQRAFVPPPAFDATKEATYKAVGQGAKAVASLVKLAPKEKAPDEEDQQEKLDKETTSVVDSILKYVKEAIAAEGAQNLNYTLYPRHPAAPDVELSAMMPMLEGPPPFSQWFSPCKLVRLLWRFAQSAIVGYTDLSKILSPDRWMQVFGVFFLQPTEITKDDLWKTDRGFAQQYLSGTNPVMITRVTSLDRDVLQGGGEPLVGALGRKTLDELIDAKNLYVVNYDAWDPSEGGSQASPRTVLSENASWPKMYYYSPMVLFSVPEGDDKLMPLAIQIEKTAKAKVFTPDEQEWTYAKMVVTSADENVHEWLSHLGKTHLTIEPQIVAAWNQLKSVNHDLYDFLSPHYQDTLFLSWAARLTLLYYATPEDWSDPAQVAEAAAASTSVADAEFAVGAAKFLQVLLGYWTDYSFFDYGFEAELAKRGFTGDLEKDPLYEKYLYLQDGLKLWKAIGQYASDYVDSQYATDLDLKNDAILQKWASEVADPGRANIKGFPSPMPDKATLAKCLQTTIWTTSGLHSAVNFPQFDFMAYQPNRPSAFLQPIDKASESLQWAFDNAVSTNAIASGIAQTIWLLTLPSDHTLVDLTEHSDKPFAGAYEKFKKNLLDISNQIKLRNDKLPENDVPFKYTYLDPTFVPASIDI
mmetsp:Transcript_14598/g.47562  ORF Transcript_14598/g.47562 Transcript_14598/m.47562 type:complete len:672 (-) Transcript_14598:863-2878(-)